MDWGRKIIKTAIIQECKQYKTYNQQLNVLVKQYGGWPAGEPEGQEPDRINNSLSIKVPVAQFEDVLVAINGLDCKTLQKNITAGDVTGQVVDRKEELPFSKRCGINI